MIRLILTFFILAVVIGFTVQTVRRMNGQELWDLTKLAFFSTMCSLAAVVIMTAIVVLF
jgi:hypothetical protein